MGIVSKVLLPDLKEGMAVSFIESISEEMVDSFASLTGDISPLHMSDDFSQNRNFRGRVVHGILLMGLVSRMVGVHLPGENALLQSINFKFLAPIYIGDTLQVQATVDHVSEASSVILLKVQITNTATNVVLVRGKAQVGLTR
jgi:3-hydroxybutyryl-CoA dehydratase